MQSVSLSVDDEFKAMGDALAGLIADIKGGKTVIQDLTDAVQSLIPAVSAIGSMSVDVKKPDNQAYIAYALMKVLEPA